MQMLRPVTVTRKFNRPSLKGTNIKAQGAARKERNAGSMRQHGPDSEEVEQMYTIVAPFQGAYALCDRFLGFRSQSLASPQAILFVPFRDRKPNYFPNTYRS